jgi:hypothetical protein
VGDSSGTGPGSGSGGPGSPDSGQPPDADHGGKGAHDGKGDHPKPEHGTEGHDKDHGKHDGRDDGKHDHSHDKNHGKDGHGTHGHDGKGAGKDSHGKHDGYPADDDHSPTRPAVQNIGDPASAFPQDGDSMSDNGAVADLPEEFEMEGFDEQEWPDDVFAEDGAFDEYPEPRPFDPGDPSVKGRPSDEIVCPPTLGTRV